MFYSRHLIVSPLITLLFAIISLAMSIPTPEDGSITQPSGSNTNSAIDRLNSTLRVDPTQHPDWAGVMHLSDCAKARFYFNGRVAFYDPQKSMTFWSRRWTVRPPGNEFELPFGAKYSKSPYSPLISRSPRNTIIHQSVVLNGHRQQRPVQSSCAWRRTLEKTSYPTATGLRTSRMTPQRPRLSGETF